MKGMMCSRCIWEDECAHLEPEENSKCDYFTPVDDEDADITYYEADLRERAEVYRLVEEEYGDDG